MSHPLEPSSLLTALLKEERSREQLDAAHVERLRSNVRSALAATAQGAPLEHANPETTAGGSAGAATATTPVAAATAIKTAALLFTGTVIGAVGGFAVGRGTVPPAHAPVSTEMVATSSGEAPSDSGVALDAGSSDAGGGSSDSSVDASTSRPTPSRRVVLEDTGTSSRIDPPAAGTLEAERVLFEIARTAVARGHHSEAREALRRHAERYPNGAFVEEREGLEVLLIAHTEPDRAAAAYERFRARYPSSVLLPAIERALPR
jgi:TolA-binding protein